MKLTNIQMDNYLQSLQKISEKVTGVFAYAVARNIRKISEELVEYRNLKDNTIRKYGTETEDGRSTIEVGSEAFYKYVEEMKDYNEIAHEVPIQMISQKELLSSHLNANEILSVDFMIQEENNNE